jgi:hypothetical protein
VGGFAATFGLSPMVRSGPRSLIMTLTWPFSGAEGTRTPDPLHAMQVRYQLRHSPVRLVSLQTGQQRKIRRDQVTVWRSIEVVPVSE